MKVHAKNFNNILIILRSFWNFISTSTHLPFYRNLHIYRLFDIYKPEVCHFIDCEASLSNVSPLLDAFHPACEIIRGDTQ